MTFPYIKPPSQTNRICKYEVEIQPKVKDQDSVRHNIIILNQKHDKTVSSIWNIDAKDLDLTSFNFLNDVDLKKIELAEIKDNPLGNLYINNHFSLPYICSKCTLESVCSGGYIIHSYSSKNGFDNESVFSKDLIKFISHVQNTLVKPFKVDLGLEAIDSKEVIEYVDKLKNEEVPKPELMSF